MDRPDKPPTLDELLAKCDPETKMDCYDEEWLNAPAVGNEIILDQFHYHEAIDRIHIQLSNLDNSLGGHPVIEANPELKKLYEESLDKLSELYQKIGNINPYSS